MLLYAFSVQMLKAATIPLKDRILRSSSSTSPVPMLAKPGRPMKYKLWHESRLKLAYDAVKKENLSVRKAALNYDVPNSTLQDRLSGRVQFGATSGPQKYLTDEEE